MKRPSAGASLVAGLSLVLLGALWMLRVGPRSSDMALANDASWVGGSLDVIAALTAATLCAGAVGRAGNRRARVAWIAQSAACTLWLLAPATWLLADDGVAAFSMADVGRSGYLVFAALGFWLTSRGSDIRSPLRLFLDGAVGAASVLIVVWALAVAPFLVTGSRAMVEIVPSLVFPLGALVVLIFYTFLAFTEFRPGHRRMPLLFVIGLICICMSDIRYAELTLAAGMPVKVMDNAGWLFGFALIAAAARSYGGTTDRQIVLTTTWWLTYTPYLMLIPATATMLWQAVTGRDVPAIELVAGCAIIVVILGRQLLILAENRTLVARLTASEQRWTHASLHDSLTGLGNRALLLSRLAEVLADGDETADRHLALIFCDLDDFKTVNDSLGHHAGDELLVQVATRLRSSLRSEDTIVRLGGDEYAALMACPPAEAQTIVHRMWQSFQDPYPVLGHQLRLSASIGVAFIDPTNPFDADELLREADHAMYAVKRAGKNGVQVYAPDHLPPAQATSLRDSARPPAFQYAVGGGATARAGENHES